MPNATQGHASAKTRLALLAGFMFCVSVSAQEPLVAVGMYKGTYSFENRASRRITVGIVLEVASVQNGKVAGKLALNGGQCQGDYVFEGTYQGTALNIVQGPGTLQGCGNGRLQLKVDGQQLVGNFGPYDVTLSK